ncbi:ABC transporter ATP-binding protein [Thiospirochaeta perfilievii]|uniref:ABC transporter ATP-binding protein n=1 Tax=Thiospirochaeta perfilievii TaxID=252967 RepID=A0A5C1Q888_9SPIO|nr:ABC transporter ATP-binding protein [Thiospirochaeta perfilievii]QEN04265.1 ABC transporter ATP-binding protein [Thiospirochaeta perfilievii]
MSNIISIKNILFGYQEDKDIFKDFSIEIPGGVTTFIGQNGTGKSTLMLLAAGRLLPENGQVKILDRDTKNITDEEELNRLASVIYQNMEFDTEETIGNLLKIVYQNGHHSDSVDDKLISEIVEVMELQNSLEKKTNAASKGEMQRVIIAFSLLYGSPIILMDEPVFALENDQKDRVFKYITSYAHKFNRHIIYSIHDIDISKKFCDNVVLFFKDGSAKVGPKEEILTREMLEEAYQVPMHLLHEREKLNRKTLLNRDKMETGLTGKVID